MEELSCAVSKYFDTFYPKSPLKVRLLNIFKHNAINSFEDIARYKRSEFTMIPNCGRRCADVLEVIMKRYNYTFKAEKDNPLEALQTENAQLKLKIERLTIALKKQHDKSYKK